MFDTTLQKLSAIALRKYTEKGYFQNSLVLSILCGSKFDAPIGCFSEYEKDAATLRKLASDFGGSWVDLWTDEELTQQTCYLPEPENGKRQARIDAFYKSQLGEDLYNFFVGMIESKAAIPDWLPVDLAEVVQLSREKYRLYHGQDVNLAPDLEELPVDLDPLGDVDPIGGQVDPPEDPPPAKPKLRVRKTKPKIAEVEKSKFPKYTPAWTGKLIR